MQSAWPPRSMKNSPMAHPAYGARYCSGAGSEADAETMMEWPRASWSSSVRTTCATVDNFCPTATYTQTTPVSRWLMMVSTAIAVFPVWRSPMMSSRWPRPIGIMASTAFTPVWSGSFTGWRPTIPGATRSTGAVSAVSIGPFPSSGRPRASTTRPFSASPTGTRRMRRVRLAVSPSPMEPTSPNSTRPTELSSRFRASPNTSFGSSTSSPYMTCSRPRTRAIPSPEDTTVPISAMSTPGSWPAICSRSSAAISSARIVMVSSRFSKLLNKKDQ